MNLIIEQTALSAAYREPFKFLGLPLERKAFGCRRPGEGNATKGSSQSLVESLHGGFREGFSGWGQVCLRSYEMNFISFSIPSPHLPTVSEWSSQSQDMCPTITGLIHPWQLSISFGKFLHLLKRRCGPVWFRNLFEFLYISRDHHPIKKLHHGHSNWGSHVPSGFWTKWILNAICE